MQDLIRHSPAVIFEYAFLSDGQKRFSYISENAFDLLGLGAEALMTNPRLLDSIILQEDQPYFQDVFSNGPASDPVCITVRIRFINEIKKLELRFSDQSSVSGEILRRGIIQEAVEHNGPGSLDELYPYEEIFDKLPIGIIIHDEGKIVFANIHAHRLVGAKTRDQLIGLDIMDLAHPRYLHGFAERIKLVSGGHTAPMMEEKLIGLDQSVIDVETMALPFLYKGKIAVQVILRDISEKKRTEAQIRKNETLFLQLFQNVPMAVVMLDENGRLAEINRGFEQMFGYNENELRGKNLNDFIVPDDLQSEGIDLNNLITSNRVVSIESIRKHKSGRLVNVILCGVPVIFDSEAIGIYGVYVDITDRKKVEEELKVRNAELDNFVYKVSHDLRAPLSSILGLVNLSMLKGNTDNPMDYITLIGEKVEALDHFIGDVLSHSKNLKMEIDVGRVDLRQIIEQTFTDLGYLKEARLTKQTIKIEGVDFYSDNWRVSEIFRNLISNAIKYRQPDSADSEIVIKIHVDHLCADITFADNGIGIKETSLQSIFEMFYRATEQGEGSGIGLYIVKNAVEKLGGQIKVASRPGHGTRFHMLLPNRINRIINT